MAMDTAKRETQPETETETETATGTDTETETETGIQQIRAGMLKYCRNTEIQRARGENHVKSAHTTVSRALLLLLLFLFFSFPLFIYNYTNSGALRAGKAHTENISRSAYGFLAWHYT